MRSYPIMFFSDITASSCVPALSCKSGTFLSFIKMHAAEVHTSRYWFLRPQLSIALLFKFGIYIAISESSA
eukprot:6459748-Amphidinium_carterae.2